MKPATRRILCHQLQQYKRGLKQRFWGYSSKITSLYPIRQTKTNGIKAHAIVLHACAVCTVVRVALPIAVSYLRDLYALCRHGLVKHHKPISQWSMDPLTFHNHPAVVSVSGSICSRITVSPHFSNTSVTLSWSVKPTMN